MTRVLLMTSFLLFPRILVAQVPNIDALLGERWYGLYLNGEKAGYSMSSLAKEDDGRITSIEDARFRINMVGVRQDMSIFSKRVYGAEGEIQSIEARVTDPVSTSDFNAVVEGDGLVLTTTVGGQTTETRLPKPAETLMDSVKQAQWIGADPKVGDKIEFSVFEPMYQKELNGASYIVGEEERVFEGVPTRVYKVKTTLDLMNIESLSYIADNGTILEDVVAGIITMRLEPEEIAKDVDYSNDVIVSNAAYVDKPIENPRSREMLRLKVSGPLTADHLFNDERQSIEVAGDNFKFNAKRIALDSFEHAQLPVTDEEAAHWIKPSMFVQSDDPKLTKKAKEIVGNEKDMLAISNKLCSWVHGNMRSTFSARLSNALEVLGSLEGDCTEHSILFIGLARAAGVPAREVAGLVYVEGVQPGFYFHQWAKVWVGAWIDVDPTFNQHIADVTHIKLAEGDLLQQAKIIPVIGNMRIEVLEDAAAAAQ